MHGTIYCPYKIKIVPTKHIPRLSSIVKTRSMSNNDNLEQKKPTTEKTKSSCLCYWPAQHYRSKKERSSNAKIILNHLYTEVMIYEYQ